MTSLVMPHDPVGEPGDPQEVPHGVQTLGKCDHGSPGSAGGFTDTWAGANTPVADTEGREICRKERPDGQMSVGQALSHI